jgi:hypothetical protein
MIDINGISSSLFSNTSISGFIFLLTLLISFWCGFLIGKPIIGYKGMSILFLLSILLGAIPMFLMFFLQRPPETIYLLFLILVIFTITGIILGRINPKIYNTA